MKLQPVALSLSLLVSLTVASKYTKPVTEKDGSSEATLTSSETVLGVPATTTTLSSLTTTAISATATPAKAELNPKARGSGENPPDGKDGKPHDGPFVETNAERSRKKEKGEKSKAAAADDVGSAEEVDGEKSSVVDGKGLPKSNDGVMNDKSGPGPKEGTRGTEGGVSQKNKEKTSAKEKEPERPKEMPPLPHSEEQRINGEDPDAPPSAGSKDGKTDESRTKDPALLEKPADLPETPQKIPHPQSPGGNNHLKIGDHAPTTVTDDDDSKKVKDLDIGQPFHSFIMSLAMIIFSEIGDKTFLVAALMAMRHARMAVFTAAFSALFTMTVLSAILGHAVPSLLPVVFTNFIAAALFLVFGVRMIFEAKKMSPDDNATEEMKEVELELEEKAHKRRRPSMIDPYTLESGRAKDFPSPSSSSASSRSPSPSRSSCMTTVCNGASNLLSLLLSPAWVQTFVMTFLAEWGDRSQIATIAMAAGKDYWFVMWGAVIGHAVCTGAAVLGGRAIAGRVSMRLVTFGGAIAFLIFGIIYLCEALSA